MKKKTFICLALSTIISAGLLYVCEKSQKDIFIDKELGQPILTNFNSQAIRKIKIKEAQQDLILTQKDNQWVVENRWNFPASNEMVNYLLDTAQRSYIIRNIQLKDQRYYDYHMNADSTGLNEHTIQFFIDDKSEPYFLQIGRVLSENDQQSYANYLDTDKDKTQLTVVTEDFSSFGSNPLAWINPDFCPGFSAIRKITLEIQQKKAWELEKGNGKNWILDPAPPQGNSLNITTLKELSAALENAVFFDIANPAISTEISGLNDPYILTIEDNLGNQLIYHFGKQSEQYGFYGKIIYRPVDQKNINTLEQWILLFNPQDVKALLIPYSEFIKKQ